MTKWGQTHASCFLSSRLVRLIGKLRAVSQFSFNSDHASYH